MHIAIDIDSTIGDPTHRLHYVTGPKKDYNSFYDPDLVACDEPISSAQRILPSLLQHAYGIVFTSGRPERLRETTEKWIRKHFEIGYRIDMYLRKDRDYSKAAVLKEPWFAEIKTWSDGLIVLDDDETVLKMAAKHGIALEAPACWDVLRYMVRG